MDHNTKLLAAFTRLMMTGDLHFRGLSYWIALAAPYHYLSSS